MRAQRGLLLLKCGEGEGGGAVLKQQLYIDIGRFRHSSGRLSLLGTAVATSLQTVAQ